MSGERPALRFRLYVDGRLDLEHWAADAVTAGAIGLAQVERALAVEAAGRTWMAEVWNPEAPEEEAYLRFGTDPGGMVFPYRLT